jgi:hypothetical protein
MGGKKDRPDAKDDPQRLQMQATVLHRRLKKTPHQGADPSGVGQVEVSSNVQPAINPQRHPKV